MRKTLRFIKRVILFPIDVLTFILFALYYCFSFLADNIALPIVVATIYFNEWIESEDK